ncbi:sugar transferase [Sphingomonas sp. 1P06PA]|uniref:sugar transferase n=1 Tax=Sphingomonas sp. 1P06PA TaxID=554121 RepID=UPI0039A5C3A5
MHTVPHMVSAPAASWEARPIAVSIRTCDIMLSLFGIVLLAPVFLLIALFVVAIDPGPILFAQRRLGHGGRSFRCFKFRTMAVDAEARLAELLRNDPLAAAEWARDQKLRNDPRIVGIGRLLRKSSLDELPQLFNVLRGEMSLVGPRPIVEAEIVRYGHYYTNYCAVRPGITGLWQISGRNMVSYRRRVACDVAFARALDLRLYFRILLMTVPSVLLVRGSY